MPLASYADKRSLLYIQTSLAHKKCLSLLVGARLTPGNTTTAWAMWQEVLCHWCVIPARWYVMDKLRGACHDDRGAAWGSALLWGVDARCPMASVGCALETAALPSPATVSAEGRQF